MAKINLNYGRTSKVHDFKAEGGADTIVEVQEFATGWLQAPTAYETKSTM